MIYDAGGRDQEEAAKNFGLIVWKVFEERPETWTNAHGIKDGREIRGRTYFRWPSPTDCFLAVREDTATAIAGDNAGIAIRISI